MNEIPYLSISQLKTHALNPTHWILEKVYKIRSPGSKATEFGGAFHDEVERYLKDEIKHIDELTPDVRRFMEDWLEADNIGDHVVAWNADSVEHKFENFKIADELPPFTGVIDLLIEEPLRVIDHKTVGNKRYSLKQPDLKNDMQLILYAFYALTEINPQATEVVIQHNQFFKNLKRDKFGLIQDTLTREYVMDKINIVREEAAKVVATHEAFLRDGLEGVDNRPDACRFAFGGCNYWPVCNGDMEAEEFKRLQDSGLSAAQIADQKKDAEVANMFAKKADIQYNRVRIKEGTVPMTTLKEETTMHTRSKVELVDDHRLDLMPIFSNCSEVTKSQAKNQFDHRKLIAEAVVLAAKDHSVTTVVVPLFLVIGSDPDVTPTLTALRKAGINLIHVIS